MGTWGPALFSDDTADDVRTMYRELIEDGVEDNEATRQVLDAFIDGASDADDGPVVLLALAVTQSKVGRLDPEVAAAALGIIERGAGLERWAEDPKLLARRKAALERARQQLVGPQPTRKRLRPPKKRFTNLTLGDLFVYPTSGLYVALRVARIKTSRYGESPILVILDYTDPHKPGPGVELADRKRQPFGSPWDSVTFQPSHPTPDDRQALDQLGFEKIGTAPPRVGDDELRAHSSGLWPTLAAQLDRDVRRTVPRP